MSCLPERAYNPVVKHSLTPAVALRSVSSTTGQRERRRENSHDLPRMKTVWLGYSYLKGTLAGDWGLSATSISCWRDARTGHGKRNKGTNVRTNTSLGKQSVGSMDEIALKYRKTPAHQVTVALGRTNKPSSSFWPFPPCNPLPCGAPGSLSSPPA